MSSTKNSSIVAKCQWLEKKCKEYQVENNKLKKRLQRLEQLSSDRGVPSQMYTHEVEHCNCLIRDVLTGNSESYQYFMKITSPQSYNDLYYKILPDLKKYFMQFVRTVKNYIDFIDTHKNPGPIFTNVLNENHVSLRDKISNVRNKLNHYRGLLESSSWSVSLDEVARGIRADILKWLDTADSILRTIDGHLQPKGLEHVLSELDDTEFGLTS